MREIIQIETNKQNGLYDITEEVRHIVKNSKVPEGIVNIYVQGATAGIMDAHLKAGLIGPSETIPIINGEMGLSTWQNIFLCEFDGPRTKRTIVVTVIKDS